MYEVLNIPHFLTFRRDRQGKWNPEAMRHEDYEGEFLLRLRMEIYLPNAYMIKYLGWTKNEPVTGRDVSMRLEIPSTMRERDELKINKQGYKTTR